MAPPGAIISQNIVWFDVSATVVAHRGPDGFGQRVDIGDQLLDGFLLQVGVGLERGIEVVDVRGVMLVVMDRIVCSSICGSSAL